MNWFKKLLASKIQVTIITPPPEGVTHSTTPRVEEVESPNIKRVAHSNLRFTQDIQTDYSGKETVGCYRTEEFVGGKWRPVIESICSDRDKAIQLHLMLLEKQDIEPKKTKVIFWEGLNADEAKTWSALM